MSFSAPKTQPNGAFSQTHEVIRVEVSPADGTAKAVVNSFASEAAMSAVPRLINWQDTYDMPLSAVADPDAWLISAEGPFAGGMKLVEGTSLEIAKERLWNEIKQERDEKEASGFPYLDTIFDSDSRSVQRIVGAVLAAQAAVANGQAFTIDWTVADNSVRTLDASMVIGMPVALAGYADELHETSRVLRAQIEAAETVEEVKAVVWPSMPAPEPEPEPEAEPQPEA